MPAGQRTLTGAHLYRQWVVRREMFVWQRWS
jgi:hypothetical protein